MTETRRGVSNRVGMYNHLEQTDPIAGELIDIDHLARTAVKKNYGVHRLLSAIIRARDEKKAESGKQSPDYLADILRDALNDGLY